MVFVMTLTSTFLVLVMVMIWKTHVLLIMAYVLTIFLIEGIFLSSVFYKFLEGGYLPLAFSAFLMLVMYVWNYVYRKRYMYDLHNKVSMEKLKEIASDPNIRRVPGVALFYSELVHGISPIFTHYIANVSALHKVLVFVSVKSLPISKVPADERFFFQRIKPNELCIFRCVVRYGYTDVRRERESIEAMLVVRLKEFIIEDLLKLRLSESGRLIKTSLVSVSDGKEVPRIIRDEVEKEVQLVDNEFKNGGVVYLFGENEVVASKDSGLAKKLLIDYAYNWLKRCLRQPDEVFAIPRKRLLKVGMTYEL